MLIKDLRTSAYNEALKTCKFIISFACVYAPLLLFMLPVTTSMGYPIMRAKISF